MKNFILVVALLLAVGYFVNSCVQDKRKENANRVEREVKEREAEEAAAELENRIGANSDWIDTLLGTKSLRLDPVLTIELEKLWLTGKPILFAGEITDISSYSESHYTVTLRRSVLYSRGFIDSELHLSLSAPKEIIDSFLSENPALSDGIGLNRGVAVAARIHGIRTSTVLNSDGESVDVKIGDGELLGLVFTGKAKL